jgi:hypothetical protein
MFRAPEQTVKKPLAFFRLRRLCLAGLTDGVPPSLSAQGGLRLAVGDQRVDVLDR